MVKVMTDSGSVADEPPIPDLSASLLQAGLLTYRDPLPRRGPRFWWDGPLDVEGLALGSVSLATIALFDLLDRRDLPVLDSSRVAASFDSLRYLRLDGMPLTGFDSLSDFFRTRNGWIRTHANYPHHSEILRKSLSAKTKRDVSIALKSMHSLDAEELIVSRGGVAAAVRTRAEWLRSNKSLKRSVSSWIDFELSQGSEETFGSTAWNPWHSRSRPLSGLRVLDLTRVVAGPTASRFLGLAGADVLRVDPPAIPELLVHHLDSNFGKHVASGDFADPGTLDQIRALLESAHVVLLGYRGNSLDRFGLSPDSLRESYPWLVIVSLNAWGDGGHWRNRRGFDSIVQAASGLSSTYKQADGSPGALPVQALDHATGYGVAAAVLSLMRARLQEGVTGCAQLSLSGTSDVLFDLRAPSSPPQAIRSPERETSSCEYGQLEYVSAPVDLLRDAREYPFPPTFYGRDPLRWSD